MSDLFARPHRAALIGHLQIMIFYVLAISFFFWGWWCEVALLPVLGFNVWLFLAAYWRWDE
jgi:hypothetical protein